MSSTTDDLERAFLESIVAHPEDSTQWLILADWLEDREDPRAELVRLTWSLHHEPEHPDFPLRQRHVQHLLAQGVRPVAPRRICAGIEFVWIPPGRCRIGSPPGENARDGDEIQHWVQFAQGFWMGAYPVTQSQWQSVMGHNPSAFSTDRDQSGFVQRIGSDERTRLPVESISWLHVADYLRRLHEQTGISAMLPSEAEWEYACRAGTTTAFPFGNVLDGRQANCDGSYPYGSSEAGRYLRHPTVVGSYPPNPWGLYDLIGNVGEWTRDTYRYDYEALPPQNPVWEEADPRRIVFRGGSWDRLPIYCRTAYRNHIGPLAQLNNIGFRLRLVAG